MFLAEIIVGYKTGSLALIADAFHMLSDVLAQVIALYAIRLAAKTEWKPHLSYGWQRAELLGALYNGIFLLALCFSILLDAIERFFKPEDIENPKLVLIVGSIGLLCNLLGLVLFHDHAGHGHSHGGHSHSHSQSHGKTTKAAEKQSDLPSSAAAAATVSKAHAAHPEKGFKHSVESDEGSEKAVARRPSLRYHSSLERISPLKEANLQNLQQAALDVQRHIAKEEFHEREERRRSSSFNSSKTGRPDDVAVSMGDEPSRHAHDPLHHDDHEGHEHHSQEHDHEHAGEDKKGKKPSGEDLNMRGIFLHVLGDALGSVGVIFTALFLWLTDYSWRFYMDPIISLFITAIIVHSALPLVRSASFILLQGVPVGVEIEEIRDEIKAIPDVISIHDLHIWQLTNIKMVASLHVLVTNQEAFERVSKAVKVIMHQAGVHSTTIQPEFPGMHPYLSQGADGLRLRKVMSEDEARILIAKRDMSSRATSIGAMSDEFLSEGAASHAASSAQGLPHVDGPLSAAAAAAAKATSTAGGVVLTPEQERTVEESNCTLLCIDGEQACDVGSCCTVPVKR
ncbi:hypothetical protein BGZ70_003497 [Mortierella alpina]|uniref:Cation efflux protein n=1 Tax=Mortierella alpina TaxID=64518 RepID=A0A9P6LW54_MORAP|nr:hypothetical protein BGZ70_003497 [Mortierella alpina]